MAVEIPRTLSPSKASAFTDCPLAFRYSIIDHLPEPPSPLAVKGTLVHSVLEGLFWERPPGRRSLDAAFEVLEQRWKGIDEDEEFVGLELCADGKAEFRRDTELLIRNYFRIEDPDSANAIGVELGMETHLGTTVLRGVIDRLDLTNEGQLVVIDYKTGRAPSSHFEKSRLNGVHTYALLCDRVLGRYPVEVRLLYLRDPVVIVARPTEQSVRGHTVRTTAVWSAIERACEREDFRPRVSGLCKFCNFQDLCPAFGAAKNKAPKTCDRSGSELQGEA
ncbi:MAG: RecB family exonuclease [Acidimicrobiales bacterium]